MAEHGGGGHWDTETKYCSLKFHIRSSISQACRLATVFHRVKTGQPCEPSEQREQQVTQDSINIHRKLSS